MDLTAQHGGFDRATGGRQLAKDRRSALALRRQKLISSDEVGRSKSHATNRLRPTSPPGLPLVSDVRYYCANRCLRRHEKVLARLFLGHWGVFYVDC